MDDELFVVIIRLAEEIAYQYNGNFAAEDYYTFRIASQPLPIEYYAARN